MPAESWGRRAWSAPRHAPALVLVMLLAALLSGVGAAPASADEDPGAKRAQVQAEKAKVAAKLDAARASDDEVDKAITTLQANVASQRDKLASDQAKAAVAQLESDKAAAEAVAAEQQSAAAEQLLRESAVMAYVKGRSSEVTNASRPDDAAVGQMYQHVADGQQTDALDSLRATKLVAAERRAKASKAAEAALSKLKASQAQAIRLNSALADQQAFSNSVNDRIERLLAESQGLEATDKALAAEIAKRQAALAVRVRGSVGGGGAAPPITGSGDIVTVGGIQVNRAIANQIQGLLSAASAAGFNLGGGGYRSSQAQIATRRNNCGPSNYDIYQKPASQCSPPTARPGSSMHERGLAIDFTCNGALIQSRSTSCYRWLAGNASRFGMYNLPSEPWHWSTNGN